MTGAREQLRTLVGDDTLFTDWNRQLPIADGSRPAAVLVLFGVLDELPADHDARHRAVSSDLDVLLLARAPTLRSHPGQVAFPGGRIDDGDDGPVSAALREAEEETGLDPSGVEVLGELPELGVLPSVHRVTPVLGWWERQSSVRVVDEDESAQVFRVPVADLLNPGNRYTTRMMGDGPVRTGPAWRLNADGRSRLLWGFTAGVLDRLFTRLGWTEPWDTSRVIEL